MASISTNASHQAVVAKFGAAVQASDGAAYIWFNKEDCLWHVRAETPEGMHSLTTPDGSGFGRLEGLLQILAGVGVSEIKVEFNGVPPVYYDRVN